MEKSIRFNTFSTVISSMVGLIAIGLIIWRGGALAMWVNAMDEKHTTKVLAVERRVTTLEVDGSIKVQRHVDLDDKLQALNESRLTKLEAAIESIRYTLGEMNGDTKVIRRSIDTIAEQLRVHNALK